MNFIKIIKGLFNKKSADKKLIGNKDPKDYKKCDLSTDWEIDTYYCVKCKNSTTHREFMSSACNSCGHFGHQTMYGRSYRKIYIDGVWKYQIRYKNGEEEIRDGWYE